MKIFLWVVSQLPTPHTGRGEGPLTHLLPVLPNTHLSRSGTLITTLLVQGKPWTPCPPKSLPIPSLQAVSQRLSREGPPSQTYRHSGGDFSGEPGTLCSIPTAVQVQHQARLALTVLDLPVWGTDGATKLSFSADRAKGR